jgi:hypothetical protein
MEPSNISVKYKCMKVMKRGDKESLKAYSPQKL